MSKPIREVRIKTADGKKASVDAVFDTGSFYTIIRQDALPTGAKATKLKRTKTFGTARRGSSKLLATGEMILEIRIEGHWIRGDVFVSPHRGSDLLIGAGMMQLWDISVKNDNGHTTIHVGHDMNDPDIQTVL